MCKWFFSWRIFEISSLQFLEKYKKWLILFCRCRWTILLTPIHFAKSKSCDKRVCDSPNIVLMTVKGQTRFDGDAVWSLLLPKGLRHETGPPLWKPRHEKKRNLDWRKNVRSNSYHSITVCALPRVQSLLFQFHRRHKIKKGRFARLPVTVPTLIWHPFCVSNQNNFNPVCSHLD